MPIQGISEESRLLTEPSQDIHASTHEAGGSDEINVTGLSGVLADDQNAIAEDGIDTSAIHDDQAGEIAAVTEKVSPASADVVLIEDSADTNNKKRVQIGNLAGAAVTFGNDYQSAFDATRTTTTSATFQTKISIVTPALTGTYRIGWAAVVDGSSFVEVQAFNVTDVAVIGVAHINKPGDSGEALGESGFGEVVFTGATKTIEVQFRDQAGGNTVGCSGAALELWRVA